MTSFQGNDGTKWPIVISTTTLIRLRREIDVDLMTVVDGELLQQLYEDPEKLALVMFHVCEPKMEFEEFTELFSGEALDSAHDALMEGLLTFFPKAHRETLEAILRTSREGQVKVMKVLNGPAVSEAMTKELDELEEKLLATLGSHGSESISLPGS